MAQTAWSLMKLLDRILDRHAQISERYEQFNDARDEIVEFFRPDLGIETDEDYEGDFFGEAIFEGTPPWAARVMATGFQGNLVSKSIDWLSYLMADTRLRGVDPLDKWVQDVKEHMTDAYQNSTFYDEQPQFTLDAVTIGSPVMFGEEDEESQRMVWQPQHYKHIKMFYDKFNRPYGCIVDDPNFTSKDLLDQFVPKGNRRGQDRDGRREKMLSLQANQQLDGGIHNQNHNVIRAVFKESDEIWDTPDFKKPPMDPRNPYKWISVYFEKVTDKDKDKPLEVGTYFSKPFVVWNYNKKRHEVLSRTPAYDAMYDNYSLQTVAHAHQDAIQLQTYRPMWINEEIKGRTQLHAKGEMYVSPAEYKQPPIPIEVAGNPGFTKDLMDDFKEAIKRHFHLDLFNLFSQIARDRNQPLTATQIWQMAGERSTLLSPAVESHSKYLAEVDERMLEVEMRAQRGPFDEDTMANVMDAVMSHAPKGPIRPGITAKFVGPLARAQRIQQAVEPIISGLQTLAPVFDLFPQSKAIIREYELADRLAEVTDFPMDAVATKEEYMEIVASMQAKAQSDEQFLKAIEMAKVAPGMGKPVDPSSMAAQGQGQGQGQQQIGLPGA